MKNILIFFTLLTLLLSWCSQKAWIHNETIVSDASNTTHSTPDQEKILWGKLTSPIHIPWIYSPITLGEHDLLFSWVFSLQLPQGLENREYVASKTPVSNGYMEYMWFSTNDNAKFFGIHVYNLSWRTYSDKEICHVEYFDWYITKSEKIYTLQWIQIYTYFSTLMVSGPDFDPFKVIDTKFCFVNNDIAYKFSASNFSHEYMDTIINSFTFLE